MAKEFFIGPRGGAFSLDAPEVVTSKTQVERFALQGIALDNLLCQSPVSEFETLIMSTELKADGCLRIHARDEQGARFDCGKQSVKNLSRSLVPAFVALIFWLIGWWLSQSVLAVMA